MNKKRTPAHVTAQRKIDRERDGMRVLGKMVSFQIRDDTGGYYDGIKWTVEALVSYLGDLSIDMVCDALEWLLAMPDPYVGKTSEQWYTTKAGRIAYQLEIRSPKINTGTSVQDFRNEALTDMDIWGEQSELTRAALPATGRPTASRIEDGTIERCECVDLIRRVAKDVGMTPSEAQEGLQTGRVRRCKGTEKIPPHWGVFHRHNGRNGQQWQVLCITCRKRMRK